MKALKFEFADSLNSNRHGRLNLVLFWKMIDLDSYSIRFIAVVIEGVILFEIELYCKPEASI